MPKLQKQIVTLKHHKRNRWSFFAGSITVAALKTVQTQYFDGQKDALLNELPSMITDEQTCETRKRGISILVELEKFQKGAEALLTMKKMFKLQGDFSNIQSVFQNVSQKLIKVRRF